MTVLGAGMTHILCRFDCAFGHDLPEQLVKSRGLGHRIDVEKPQRV
jgi:hypothetical protein